MKRIRRVLAITLSLLIAVFSIPILFYQSIAIEIEPEKNPNTGEIQIRKTGSALETADIVESGVYDSNTISDLVAGDAYVTYTLDKNGTLILQGNGNISSWRAPTGTKKAIIGENIEIDFGSIDCYFNSCTTLEQVELPVTITHLGGFYRCSGLKSVIIPSNASPNYIGEEAFEDCTNLTSFVIPKSVKTILYGAFKGCTRLTAITIPKNVQYIDQDAFKDTGIKKFTIPANLGYDGGLIEEESVSKMYYTGSEVTYEIVGPHSSSETTITVGPDVKTINKIPLAGIGSAVNVIFLGSHDYDTRLFESGYRTSIYRKSGSSTVTLEEMLGGVKKIAIPKSVAGYKVTKIGNYAFDGNKYAQSVTVPSSVKTIGPYAFYNCSKLGKVKLSSGLTSIGKFAFYGCNSLETIKLPETLNTIGTRAFWHCYSLTSISIPESVTSIGDNAFGSCTGLTSVSIGTSTDKKISAVKSLVVDEAYAATKSKPISIKKNAFKKCTNLKKVTIGPKVNAIGSQAFNGCKSLSKITIKTKKLTKSKVGSMAFTGVKSKAKVYVPKSKYKAYKAFLKKKGMPKKAVYKKI